jgi:hypothetical protein
MHKLLLIATLGSTLLATPAFAASPSKGNFGIGVGGGTGTTGISMKYYLSDASALQGVVGVWGVGRYEHDGLGLSADYLFEMPAFATSEVVDVGWNVGPGLWLAANSYGYNSYAHDPYWHDSDWHESDRLLVGASGVLGLEFLIQPIPLDIVLEYRPSVMVVPGLGFDLVSFDGHVRFYF